MSNSLKMALVFFPLICVFGVLWLGNMTSGFWTGVIVLLGGIPAGYVLWEGTGGKKEWSTIIAGCVVIVSLPLGLLLLVVGVFLP